MLSAEIADLFILGYAVGFGCAFFAACLAAVWHILKMI